LSDFRNKQARKKKQDQGKDPFVFDLGTYSTMKKKKKKGGPSGDMTLNAVLDASKVRPTSPFADLGFDFDLKYPFPPLPSHIKTSLKDFFSLTKSHCCR